MTFLGFSSMDFCVLYTAAVEMWYCFMYAVKSRNAQTGSLWPTGLKLKCLQDMIYAWAGPVQLDWLWRTGEPLLLLKSQLWLSFSSVLQCWKVSLVLADAFILIIVWERQARNYYFYVKTVFKCWQPKLMSLKHCARQLCYSTQSLYLIRDILIGSMF